MIVTVSPAARGLGKKCSLSFAQKAWGACAGAAQGGTEDCPRRARVFTSALGAGLRRRHLHMSTTQPAAARMANPARITKQIPYSTHARAPDRVSRVRALY